MAEPVRKMTSAIPGLSVAEVRRGLARCRERWATSGGSRPFDPSSDVGVGGLSLQSFAFLFVRGHHIKRHDKSRKRRDSHQ